MQTSVVSAACTSSEGRNWSANVRGHSESETVSELSRILRRDNQKRHVSQLNTVEQTHFGRIRFSETETGSSLVSTVLSIRLEKLKPVS